MSTGYNWNLSDLFAYLTTKPACVEADTLCRITNPVPFVPTMHAPQFVQDGLTFVQNKVGVSPMVTTVATPVVATAAAVAIYKTRTDLATLVSEAVYNAIKDNKALVKVVKGMKNDKAALDMLNRFSPAAAQALSTRVKNYSNIATAKDKAKVLENIANTFTNGDATKKIAANPACALLAAPAQTKAQADAAAKAAAPKAGWYVPGFATAKAVAGYGYSKLPAASSLNPLNWRAKKATA